jgi:uncharacterized protein (TIGR02453 family)
MLVKQTLQFLSGLKKNNNKEWFDANRTRYEAARTDYANFLQMVIEDLQKSDPGIAGLSAKDCMFRINRDIRFSNDKTPYKSNFGAIIKRGGRRSPFAGYYFHCAPGSAFIGGGLWMPEAATLKKVRQEIDYHPDEFLGLLKQKEFKKTYGDLYSGDDVKLSTVPKGYDRENPVINYLKLKSFISETPVTDEELLKPGLHKKTVKAFESLQPLVMFLNRAIVED